MSDEQPTVYATLMDERTNTLLRELNRKVRSELEVFVPPFVEGMEEWVRKAYVAGICDGFVQGVAAEEKRSRTAKEEA